MAIDPENLLSRGFFPDHTELQERLLKTTADIFIGDRCQIAYGLSGSNVAICEFCSIQGNITAHGDLRLDNFCEIIGDVTAERDAFLGEGVKIRGKLTVRGDMDIGDNVQIERGFEAKGWIVIRNPMPVIVYVLLYLMALLHFEREDELENFIREMSRDDAASESFLLIPPHSSLTVENLFVPTPIAFGARNRLYGNIRAESVEVGELTTIFGSIRSPRAISIGARAEIHGDVVSNEQIKVSSGAHILGNMYAPKLELHEEALVDGLIKAPDGLKFWRER